MIEKIPNGISSHLLRDNLYIITSVNLLGRRGEKETSDLGLNRMFFVVSIFLRGCGGEVILRGRTLGPKLGA